MAAYLDTSALAKIYHQEIGSAFVENLVDTDPPVFLSRLGSLELQSVLAGKIRNLYEDIEPEVQEIVQRALPRVDPKSAAAVLLPHAPFATCMKQPFLVLRRRLIAP